MRSLAGAEQEVAIAPPIFPVEALVDNRQPLLPEPLHYLLTARVVVVAGHVSLDDFTSCLLAFGLATLLIRDRATSGA